MPRTISRRNWNCLATSARIWSSAISSRASTDSALWKGCANCLHTAGRSGRRSPTVPVPRQGREPWGRLRWISGQAGYTRNAQPACRARARSAAIRSGRLSSQRIAPSREAEPNEVASVTIPTTAPSPFLLITLSAALSFAAPATRWDTRQIPYSLLGRGRPAPRKMPSQGGQCLLGDRLSDTAVELYAPPLHGR